MTKCETISLINNNQYLQSLNEQTWIVNSMKVVQFFEGYRSNTYLVDSRNLNNANLLKQISKSDVFGCYFDIINSEGNFKINQLAVACSQGVVIFTSFEKESNEVMKSFFSSISSKKCYARGITMYGKILGLYNINIQFKNVDADENNSDFMKFRRQNSFYSFLEDNRKAVNSNSVLGYLMNAFEASCIDFYYSKMGEQRKSNFVSQNTPSFPPGIDPALFAKQDNNQPKSKEISKNTSQNNSQKASTFSISPKSIVDSSKNKNSEIDKRFWKNLDTLIAILSSTNKIEIENGKYFCKQCNQNFSSYEFILEHCWNEHKAVLDSNL